MSLPKISQPYYTHNLKGSNKKIKFRPFTVKEQKILLNAKESGDVNEQIDSMCQIITMCTDGTVDPKNSPIFDIEDLFLRIRSKSVSDNVELSYKDKKSEDIIKVNINLDDVQVTIPEDHSNKILIDDNLGLMMKYPTLDMALNSDGKSFDIDIIKFCIDYVFDSENTYKFSDYSDLEVNGFLESLDFSTMQKIEKFFNTMPKLRHEVEVTIPSNGNKEKIVFEGIQDFFD